MRHASAAVPERSAHSLASAAVLGAARSMRRAASGHVAVTMAFAPGGPNARTPRRSVAASVAASCVVAAANRASDVIADDAGDAHRSVASATRAAAPRIGRSSSRLGSSSPDASAYISRSSVAKTPAAPPRRFTSSLCESTARTFASSTFGVARATAGSGATGTGKRSRARSASGRYTLSARSRSRGTPACAAARHIRTPAREDGADEFGDALANRLSRVKHKRKEPRGATVRPPLRLGTLRAVARGDGGEFGEETSRGARVRDDGALKI